MIYKPLNTALNLLFLLTTSFVIGQDFNFVAKTSKTSLGQNERVKIEYTVNQNGADNFKAPDFSGFKIIAGPSTSVSRSWINGKTSFSRTYIYFLQPTAQGKFTIPPASISYKGKTVNSNPLDITITEGVSAEKDPNNVSQTAQDNLFLVAHVSNASPYLGESIYVEYRLYYSNNIEFSNAQFGDNPKYEGFWNQEINIKSYDRKIGDYQGKKYNYYVLKKAVLIPQKTGRLIVEPLSMDILVGIPTGEYDFFGYPYVQNTQQHFTSGSRIIQVKALPQEGKPVDFTGAVGDYQLAVSANKNTINTDESTRINVEISGVGNQKLFNLPDINVPSDLEVYPPERKEQLATTYKGLKGKITDTYNVVATYNGKYIIPQVKFSYFNPEDESYHTVYSNEIVLNVEGENKAGLTESPNSEKKPVIESVGNFRFINTDTVFKPIRKNDFYGSDLFYALVSLPFLAIPLLILIGKRRKERQADVVGNKQREANKLSKKYLGEAKKYIGNKESFYTALERALHNFLKAKLHLETNDMSQDNIASLLRDKAVSETSIGQFIDILNDCNYARYTPMSKGNMSEQLKQTAQVLQQINSELTS